MVDVGLRGADAVLVSWSVPPRTFVRDGQSFEVRHQACDEEFQSFEGAAVKARSLLASGVQDVSISLVYYRGVARPLS